MKSNMKKIAMITALMGFSGLASASGSASKEAKKTIALQKPMGVLSIQLADNYNNQCTRYNPLACAVGD